MVSKLEKFTKYIFVLFLLELVACKPSTNFWDVIGEEIGESVTEEIGKYEEKLCHIDNIECYDCKEFRGDEETCRGFSYCWFNCLTNECLHIGDVAPKKYCSTYCQECSCMGDDKCTWDPVDEMCISVSDCPGVYPYPFDCDPFAYKYSEDYYVNGRMCGYYFEEVAACDAVKKWLISDETAINIGSDGQFEISFSVQDESDSNIATNMVPYYLSFNGLKIPVKFSRGGSMRTHIYFTLVNGQPSITGFVNTKPLTPLPDKTLLSLSVSGGENCELGKVWSGTIEVFQLPELWKCYGYNGNQCQCEQSLNWCRYIHSSKDCVPMDYDSSGWENRFSCASTLPLNQYHLVNHYFILENYFRRTDENYNNGECKIMETIIALNVNGKRFTDTNGIVLEAGSAVAPDDSTDAAEFEAGDSTTSSCPIMTLPDAKAVHGTFLQGRIDSKDDLGKCLSYSFTVTKDGLYMLNVKFFDIDSDRSYVANFDRIFDIKLDNVVVAGGLNPFQLIRGEGCYGFEINIYFEILNGLKTVKMTNKFGIPDWKISNGKMSVGFCNSPCEGNSAFMISAFSVARYTVTN